MAKKNKYAKKQNIYFKKKKSDLVREMNKYTKQMVANKYILCNPKYPIDTVFNLLSIHNSVQANMLIRGKEEDFADNPNEVYRVVNEQKIIELKSNAINIVESASS